MNLDLTGKNALVCGSSKGIGRAAAEEIALLGANVTLVSRSNGLLHEVSKALDRSKGQKHDFLMADVSNSADLKKKIKGLIATKTIHILVNNTGGPPAGPIVAAQPEAFLSAFQNHLIANQIITQAILEKMKSSGYGRIINVISTSVKQPLNGLGVSNTIRGAVANWAKTLANEVGEFGITVNNVLPGFTSTGRLKEIIEGKVKKTDSSEEEVVTTMESLVPLRRFADPREVGAAIAFLASPAASYISGINLPVDGGRTKSL